jgi:exonuclease III
VKRGCRISNEGKCEGKRVNAALSKRGVWRQRRGQMSFFNVGAWNVRTMLWELKLKKGLVNVHGEGLGKEQMLCDEMDRKGLAICAISETRWQGQGEFQCGEHLFLYSGTQEKTGQQGVAIVLNPVMARAWKSSGKQVNYICSRLMSVTISIGHDEFTFISVYAPTFMADEHTKDAFYHSVLQEIRSVKTGNTIVCLGDWNARVGVRDDDWKHVLGPFGNPERNDTECDC